LADDAGAQGGLTVRDATLRDLDVVASWIGTEDECRLWAGPAVSFPFEPGALAREIGFSEAEDLALADEAGTAGFGQLVWRTGDRAHLARVVVRPDARGRGYGRVLVRALLECAMSRGARLATLNVYVGNGAARRLYEVAGFTDATVPGGHACPHGALYMTLKLPLS
jgi:[ribosomal protein S18]-alanine N-acetyltransferase